MADLTLFIFMGVSAVIGYIFGRWAGYSHGFNDGKRDMLDYINKNTRTKEKI